MSRRSFDDPHGKSDEARNALLDNRNEHAPKRHTQEEEAQSGASILARPRGSPQVMNEREWRNW